MSRDWQPADVLPHRAPMLLLTRILAWDARSLAAEAEVSADHPLAEPAGGLPCWTAIEFMAQAAGALDGIRLRVAGRAVPPGYLLGTRRLDGVDGHFSPGARLRIEVEELLQDANGLGSYTCRLVDGARSWACQLTVYRPPGAEAAGSGE